MLPQRVGQLSHRSAAQPTESRLPGQAPDRPYSLDESPHAELRPKAATSDRWGSGSLTRLGSAGRGCGRLQLRDHARPGARAPILCSAHKSAVCSVHASGHRSATNALVTVRQDARFLGATSTRRAADVSLLLSKALQQSRTGPTRVPPTGDGIANPAPSTSLACFLALSGQS